MAIMRSTDFTELLDTPLRKIWFLALKDTRPEYIRWMNVGDTQRNFEDDLRMFEFGQVPAHTEGDVPIFEAAGESETKRYTPSEFVLGFNITQVMREDELHGIMAQMTTALRKSFRNLFEVQAYNLLNNSANSTLERHKGFDDLSLLSTVHTNAGNANTQSNRLSTDATLSQAGVETLQQTYHGWTGEKGLPADVTPELAIVDPSDMHLAARIFKNAMRFDTADHDENWIRKGPDSNGINEFIASRYFTATNQWFVLSKKADHDLNMMVRIHPQFETSFDFDTGNLKVKGRARLTSSHGHWIGVAGSTGF